MSDPNQDLVTQYLTDRMKKTENTVEQLVRNQTIIMAALKDVHKAMTHQQTALEIIEDRIPSREDIQADLAREEHYREVEAEETE